MITQADFLRIQARLAAQRHPLDAYCDKKFGVEHERDLHQQILDDCRLRNWIALHSRMDKRTTTTIGAPDFVVLADGGRVLLVECKARKEKLKPEQAALHAWADRLGHKVYTVRNFGEWLEVLR